MASWIDALDGTFDVTALRSSLMLRSRSKIVAPSAIFMYWLLMFATHSERDTAPDDQRQDDSRHKNKPFDHSVLLPAVLAVRDLIPELLGRALVDGDAVRRRLALASSLAAALVLSDAGDDLLLAPACCCSEPLNCREHRQRP